MTLVRDFETRLRAPRVFYIMNLQARLNAIMSRVSTTVSDIRDAEPPNHDIDDFDLVSQ